MLVEPQSVPVIVKGKARAQITVAVERTSVMKEAFMYKVRKAIIVRYVSECENRRVCQAQSPVESPWCAGHLHPNPPSLPLMEAIRIGLIQVPQRGSLSGLCRTVMDHVTHIAPYYAAD